jgi:hypothetical protein
LAFSHEEERVHVPVFWPCERPTVVRC